MRYVENRTKNIFHFSRDSLAACEPRQPLAHHETLTCFCSADAYCFVTCATRRRLVSTLSASDKRKALRRCPDLSRKRDGIAVRAFSFLLSAAQNCEPILYSEAQRLGGRIGFYDAPAANAASPGRGVMPTSQSLC